MSSPVVAIPFATQYITTAQGKFGINYYVGGYYFVGGLNGAKSTHFGLVNYWAGSPSVISETALPFGVTNPSVVPNSTTLTAVHTQVLLPAQIAAWFANQFSLNANFFQATTDTKIAAGSNGATLPQSTINVDSTVGFSVGSAFSTFTVNGQTIAYTGSTATTFTGCTGGSGSLATGQKVTG